MFNFVGMSDGGINRLDNVRTEVEIISDISREVLGNNPINFEELKNHWNIRELISKTVPGFGKINKVENSEKEFQIDGRTFYDPQFVTEDGKANFRICPIPRLKGKDGEFRMMTVRSEGQYNSIIYEEEDIYREQTNRWVVLMNKDDIKDKGLRENEQVTLESSVGKMEKVTVREFDIPRGNIITYFPESNVLVPAATDPRSKIPSYKLVWVKISNGDKSQMTDTRFQQ